MVELSPDGHYIALKKFKKIEPARYTGTVYHLRNSQNRLLLPVSAFLLTWKLSEIIVVVLSQIKQSWSANGQTVVCRNLFLIVITQAVAVFFSPIVKLLRPSKAAPLLLFYTIRAIKSVTLSTRSTDVANKRTLRAVMARLFFFSWLHDNLEGEENLREKKIPLIGFHGLLNLKAHIFFFPSTCNGSVPVEREYGKKGKLLMRVYR